MMTNINFLIRLAFTAINIISLGEPIEPQFYGLFSVGYTQCFFYNFERQHPSISVITSGSSFLGLSDVNCFITQIRSYVSHNWSLVLSLFPPQPTTVIVRFVLNVINGFQYIF
jgi:hypothetical protein